MSVATWVRVQLIQFSFCETCARILSWGRGRPEQPQGHGKLSYTGLLPFPSPWLSRKLFSLFPACNTALNTIPTLDHKLLRTGGRCDEVAGERPCGGTAEGTGHRPRERGLSSPSASLAGTAHQSHSLRDLQSATSRAFPLKPPPLGFSLQSVRKYFKYFKRWVRCVSSLLSLVSIFNFYFF